MIVSHYRIMVWREIDGQTIASDRTVDRQSLASELRYEASQPGTITHIEVDAVDRRTGPPAGQKGKRP